MDNYNELALYQINDEMAKTEVAIYEAVDTETGEIQDTTLAEKMKNLQVAFKDKVSGCIYAISKREDKIELMEREIERLQKAVKILKNQSLSIRGYLAGNLEVGKNLDLGLHSISWRRSEAVEIDNEEEVPKEYLKEKITYTPDKTLIKQAIKEGKEVKGARLIERNNLQIK